MAHFLDRDGQPMVDKAKLTEEVAAPGLASVRQVISGHPAQGLTPRRLASLLRDAEWGDGTQYLELAEEMEEKDLHYLSVLGTRKRAVAGLEIIVEAGGESANDERNAGLVREALNRKTLQDEIFGILDSIGKGVSYAEIIWETSASQWMPIDFIRRDPRWFTFDLDDGATPLLRTDDGNAPLDPFKYILHKTMAKSGLPLRGGLARAAAWGYLFKNYAIKDWVVFAEVFGQPIRVGRYGPTAKEDDIKILKTAVANIGSDAAAVIPQSMAIEFIEAKRSGSTDLYERMVDWFDRQTSKAVLGQTMTTDDGSSLSQSQTHNEVRGDIRKADCVELEATLDRDLVRPLIDLNFGPQDVYPNVRVGLPEAVDVKGLSEALDKLVPLGLKVSQSVVRKKIGLPEPDDKDDLLAPAQPVSPAIATAAQASTGARATDGPDMVDQLVSDILSGDGWEPLIEPMIGDVEAFVRAGGSLEQVRDNLAEAIATMDVTAFGDTLAEANFAAAAAGQLGIDLNDNKE